MYTTSENLLILGLNCYVTAVTAGSPVLWLLLKLNVCSVLCMAIKSLTSLEFVMAYLKSVILNVVKSACHYT